MPEQQTTAAAKDYSNLYTPAAIVIAGALIGIGLYLALSSQAPAGGQGPTDVDIADVKLDGSPFIGKEDAPVVLAYWFDYQCPYCKAVDVGGIPQIPIEPAMPLLIQQYVDTGKLRIVFKNYAFLGPDSDTAALYLRAIWKLYPDKFYAWHEAMFHAQDEEHAGFGDEASIVKLTRGIAGIDADKVKADVAANMAAYQAMNDADKAEGTSLGVSGTPGFITGTTLIPGAVEFPAFQTAIDEQL